MDPGTPSARAFRRNVSSITRPIETKFVRCFKDGRSSWVVVFIWMFSSERGQGCWFKSSDAYSRYVYVIPADFSDNPDPILMGWAHDVHHPVVGSPKIWLIWNQWFRVMSIFQFFFRDPSLCLLFPMCSGRYSNQWSSDIRHISTEYWPNYRLRDGES